MAEQLARLTTEKLLSSLESFALDDLVAFIKKIYEDRPHRTLQKAIIKVGFPSSGVCFYDETQRGRQGKNGRQLTEFGEFLDACSKRLWLDALFEWADMYYVILASVVTNNLSERDLEMASELIARIESLDDRRVPEYIVDLKERLGDSWRTFLHYLALAKSKAMDDQDGPRENDLPWVRAMQIAGNQAAVNEWKISVRDPVEKAHMKSFFADLIERGVITGQLKVEFEGLFNS